MAKSNYVRGAARPRPITELLLMVEPTCTVRNTTGAWHLIHAPRSMEYSLLLAAVPQGCGGLDSTALCRVQSAMANKFHTVEPVWCIREGGYWYLANTMNIGLRRPAGHGHYGSLQAAMDHALAWCLLEPEYRQAVVGRGALRQAAEAGEVLAGAEVEPEAVA